MDYSSHFSQNELGNKQLEDALSELSQRSRVLRQTALYFLSAILLNIMFSAYIAISALLTATVFGTRNIFILLIPLLLLSIVGLFAALYDQALQRGRGIFEEIGDELEWHVKSFSPEDDHLPSRNAPPLHVRVLLRDFARSSDLPFFHNLSPSTILLWNLYFDAIVIIIITLSIQHASGFHI